MIYTQNRKVSASLCGTKAELSVIGVLSLIEDSLTELTAELGIDGLTAISKHNAIIVYVKNHIRFLRTAKWNEHITVESFVSEKKRISFCIDTCIYDEMREMIACSRIELCGIDMQSGRLRKIDTVGVGENINTFAPAAGIEFFSHRAHLPTYAESVKVRTCNVDYVHHTNNIEYIKFILNTLSVDETESNPVDEMEISYKNQSYEGDELDIYRESSDKTLYYEIKKQDISVLQCEMTLK